MGSRCRCRSSLRSFVALAAHSGRKGMSSSCSLHLEEKKRGNTEWQKGILFKNDENDTKEGGVSAL